MKVVDIKWKWIARLSVLEDKLKKLHFETANIDLQEINKIKEILLDLEKPRDMLILINRIRDAIDKVNNPESKNMLEELLVDIGNIEEYGAIVVEIIIKLQK